MKTICFYGVDGSGKTTQARIIFGKINARKNNRAVYLHLLTKKQTVFSKLHNTSFIEKAIIWVRNLKNNYFTSSFKIMLRLLNVLFDSWITTLSNKAKYKGQVVIYDRYFYDILVILAFSYPNLANYILVFAKFMPKPDIHIFCRVDAQIATKRKKEHSIEQSGLYCRLYDKLSRMVNTKNILDFNQDIKVLSERIEGIVCGKI